MKRVISVHIAEKVFQMEEDAHNFLTDILSRQINKAEVGDKIAERLEANVAGAHVVITILDVQNVLAQLGYNSLGNAWQSRSGLNNVYRSTYDKNIAGVCAGLARYFNVDPVILRILFVFAFLVGGSGILLYLILWIIIPVVILEFDNLLCLMKT